MENLSSTSLAYSESSVETKLHAEEVPIFSETNSTRDHATSDVPVLRRAAMDFLARREHSFRELTRKMQLKFVDSTPESINEVLETLKEQNLQSDDRFTESWVRYRQSRGFGYLHILADLRERGVSSAAIEKYLFADDGKWQETVEALIAKRLGETGQVEFGSKSHQKLTRYLKSRGFTAQEIQRAMGSRIS